LPGFSSQIVEPDATPEGFQGKVFLIGDPAENPMVGEWGQALGLKCGAAQMGFYSAHLPAATLASCIHFSASAHPHSLGQQVS